MNHLRTTRTCALALVLGLVGAASAAVPPPPVSAADRTASLAIAIHVTADGNGPFTPTDVPGGDSSDANGVVRTNDAVTYAVSISSNGAPATGTTFSVTAPEGTSWAGIPNTCGAPGSIIDGRVLVCDLGTIPEGRATGTPVVLRVDGDLTHGTTIAISGSTRADGAAEVAAESGTTAVSAAARYDLSKDLTPATLVPDAEGPSGETGTLLRYPIAVTWTPVVDGQGLLGHQRSSGTMRFTDDVSELFDDLPSPAVLWGEDGQPACGHNRKGLFDGLPGGRGGSDSAVRDSGTITCTQTVPGQPVDVRITDVDTRLTTAGLPTKGVGGGEVESGVKAHVVMGYISFWLPRQPEGSSLLSRNTFTALETTSTSGAPNFAGTTEPLDNNVAIRNLAEFVGPGGFKVLGQVSDDGRTTVSGSAKAGDPYITPGTTLRSHVAINNRGTATYPRATVCDVFDNRHQRLTSSGPNGFAVASGWQGAARVQFAAHSFDDPTQGRDATCDDGDGPWFSSPDDVPGGHAAVGKVRVVGAVAGGTRANLFSYTEALPAPDGTRLHDFGHLSAREGEWLHDTTPADYGAGPLADSVIVTEDKTRITKKVVDDGHDAGDTPDDTSFVVAGHGVTYALYPTVTSSTPRERTTEVTVTDVLPRGTTLRPGSASIVPDTVESITDPDGVERTKLTWTLSDVTPNAPLAPITYSVDVSPLAPAGPIDNTAHVSSPGDVSPLRYREATRALQVVTAGGVGVEKVAESPTVVVGDPLVWRLRYANTHATPLRDVDLIDVLPHPGASGDSNFHGRARLAGDVVVDQAAGEAVRYTSRPPREIDLDPSHPSNASGGSTAWCDAIDFGTASCPADHADATAFRIVRSAPVDVGQTVEHEVGLVTDGARNGDVYANRFSLLTSNLPLSVRSNVATVTVVAGSLGDRAWTDSDEDGRQGDDEAPATDVPVELSGTDDRGDDVTAHTTTDDAGRYAFDDLRPGTYSVTFTPRDDETFTRQRAGTRGDDSAVDESGRSEPVTVTTRVDAEGLLAGVTSDDTIDAGLVETPEAPEIVTPSPEPTDGSTAGPVTPEDGGAGPTATGSPGLAFTGADTRAFGVLAALALAAGTWLLVRARRRRVAVDATGRDD